MFKSRYQTDIDGLIINYILSRQEARELVKRFNILLPVSEVFLTQTARISESRIYADSFELSATDRFIDDHNLVVNHTYRTFVVVSQDYTNFFCNRERSFECAERIMKQGSCATATRYFTIDGTPPQPQLGKCGSDLTPNATYDQVEEYVEQEDYPTYYSNHH